MIWSEISNSQLIWDEYLALETPPLCTCGASRVLEEQDQRRKLTQLEK